MTEHPAAAGSRALAELLRQQRRRLVAHLAHDLGLARLGLAEDAVQHACLRALETWPAQGQPEQPAAWLYRVARHHAIDQLRRDNRLHELPAETDHPHGNPHDDLCHPALVMPPPGQRLAGELDDEELALLFATCHPRLPAITQVALGLRALVGLELATLADSLFCTPAALAQRLARARQLLHNEDLAVPAGVDLTVRREAVFNTLGLMFHLGQQAAGRAATAAADRPSATGSEQAAPALTAAPPPSPALPADPAHPLQLCWEAIRLARALCAHPATACAEADALAAWLLLHGARLTGRLDEAGDMVLLPGQPRDRWDAGLLRLGLAHLQRAQRANALTRWHLLAGIAAEHAAAPHYDHTDWPAIVRFYEQLLHLDPSAAPRLGHAIARAEAGAPEQALPLLQALLPDAPAALRPHTLAALARACERAGQMVKARQWLDQAIACARHPADARVLQRRRDALATTGATADTPTETTSETPPRRYAS